MRKGSKCEEGLESELQRQIINTKDCFISVLSSVKVKLLLLE